MNEELRWSSDTGKLLTALLAAQRKMPNAVKEKENPHLKSKYADLASVRAAVVPHLLENSIVVVQMPMGIGEDGNVRVQTWLRHTSGEFLCVTTAIPCTKADAQGVGSAITYARRYALSSLTSIATEDDDGTGAAGVAVGGRKTSKAYHLAMTTIKNAKTYAALQEMKTRVEAHRTLSPEEKQSLVSIIEGSRVPDSPKKE